MSDTSPRYRCKVCDWQSRPVTPGETLFGLRVSSAKAQAYEHRLQTGHATSLQVPK
jgi:hypothetical protein